MCARQNSPTARQPDSPTARQPDSPTARQPDSPTARQPDSPTARQPDSPTARQPDSPTARQPDSPTARQPDSPTARQPDSPTARHYTTLLSSSGAARRGAGSTPSSSRTAPSRAALAEPRALSARRGLSNRFRLGFLCALALMTLLGGLTEAVSAQTLSPPSVTVLSGDRSIRISWRSPSDDGGSPITGYDVWYRPASSPSSSWIEKSFSRYAAGIEITGLIAGQAYEVRMRAKNAIGPGAWSSIASVTPADHLDRIRFVTLTPGNKQISFTWTAPGYRSYVTITGFDIRYRPAGGSWIERSDASYIRGRIFSGLTNGQSYQFQIRAKDSRGLGFWSDIFSATPGTAPLAPAAPRLESGNKQLLVRWSPPAGNGKLTINGYKIRYRRTSTSDSWVEKSFPGYYGRGYLTGLTNGQLYEVQVQARDSRGTGDWSDAASATPNPTAPAAPALPTLAPGNEQLDVSWNAPADYGSAITDYDVQYKLTSASGWREWNSGMSTTLSATITGLTNGDSYQVRVRAENSAGAGDWSDAASATPAAQAPSKPDAPTLTVGSTQLKVAWDAPADNGAQITGYDVRYKLSSANVNAWKEWNSGDTSTTIGATITGLSNGLSYDVQVRATNSAGNSPWSDSRSATPAAQVPSKPGVPALTLGDAQLEVSWDAPADNGAAITGYDVQYKLSRSDWKMELNVGPSTTTTISVIITGLTNGFTYQVRVRAANSAGEGLWSDLVSATPVAAAPAAPANFAAAAGRRRGHADLGQPGRRRHQQVAVPAEGGYGQLRRLDQHPVQRRLDQLAHGHQSGQRHALRLQAAGGERERQWRRIR